MTRYIFYDMIADPLKDQSLLKVLEWLYEKRLALSVVAGNEIYGRFQDGVLVSTINVGSNASQHPSPVQILRSGLWYWPLKLDLPSFRRFMELGKALTTVSEQHAMSGSECHLMMLATDERYRGHGHAAELINYVLARSKNATKVWYVGFSVPLHFIVEYCSATNNAIYSLDTQKIENVELYRNLGFSVAFECTVLENTPFAFRNYLMEKTIELSAGL